MKKSKEDDDAKDDDGSPGGANVGGSRDTARGPRN